MPAGYFILCPAKGICEGYPWSIQIKSLTVQPLNQFIPKKVSFRRNKPFGLKHLNAKESLAGTYTSKSTLHLHTSSYHVNRTLTLICHQRERSPVHPLFTIIKSSSGDIPNIHSNKIAITPPLTQTIGPTNQSIPSTPINTRKR